jgi:predicted metal-dependent TIM-barrel fold hydrolase
LPALLAQILVIVHQAAISQATASLLDKARQAFIANGRRVVQAVSRDTVEVLEDESRVALSTNADSTIECISRCA